MVSNNRSNSHNLAKVVDDDVNAVSLKTVSNSEYPLANADFHLAYRVTQSQVSVSCIAQEPLQKADDGAFVAFISPPSNRDSRSFPRDIVRYQLHRRQLFDVFLS